MPLFTAYIYPILKHFYVWHFFVQALISLQLMLSTFLKSVEAKTELLKLKQADQRLKLAKQMLKLKEAKQANAKWMLKLRGGPSAINAFSAGLKITTITNLQFVYFFFYLLILF